MKVYGKKKSLKKAKKSKNVRKKMIHIYFCYDNVFSNDKKYH